MNTLTKLTTRPHPLAIGILASQAVLGASYLVGLSAPLALFDELGPPVSYVWATGMTVGASIAISGIMCRKLIFGMTMELGGTTVVWALNGVYILALFRTYDYAQVAVLMSTFIGMWLGLGGRIFQLVSERRAMRRIARTLLNADPPVLGEPNSRKSR